LFITWNRPEKTRFKNDSKYNISANNAIDNYHMEHSKSVPYSRWWNDKQLHLILTYTADICMDFTPKKVSSEQCNNEDSVRLKNSNPGLSQNEPITAFVMACSYFIILLHVCSVKYPSLTVNTLCLKWYWQSCVSSIVLRGFCRTGYSGTICIDLFLKSHAHLMMRVCFFVLLKWWNIRPCAWK